MKTHFVQFLACYSKKITAFTNMKQFFLERLDICFLTYKKIVMCSASFSQNNVWKIWDFCTRPALNGLWKHIQMLTKCTTFMTQSLNCIFKYYISSLCHVYTEISQNVWSWKFGLQSWKSIGQNVYEPCHSLTHTHTHTHTHRQ